MSDDEQKKPNPVPAKYRPVPGNYRGYEVGKPQGWRDPKNRKGPTPEIAEGTFDNPLDW